MDSDAWPRRRTPASRVSGWRAPWFEERATGLAFTGRRYTTPWSSMPSATLTKPAMFAPTMRLPGLPVSRSVPGILLDGGHDVAETRTASSRG